MYYDYRRLKGVLTAQARVVKAHYLVSNLIGAAIGGKDAFETIFEAIIIRIMCKVDALGIGCLGGRESPASDSEEQAYSQAIAHSPGQGMQDSRY